MLLVGTAGCEQENISGTESEPNVEEKKEIPTAKGHFVSQEMAVYAADEFANQYSFKLNRLNEGKKTKSKTTKKTVEHVLTLDDKAKKAALYLINYEDGGFAVVPADKRVPPILAYSNKKKMPVNKNIAIPGGLAQWLGQTTSGIYTVRKTKKKGTTNYDIGWNNLLGKVSKTKEPPGGCEEWHYSNGPLLETTWGQGVGYNNDAPYKNCNSPYNGRAWAGCVATAIAQIIRYHEYPNNYDWKAMPNDNGSNEVSELMFDVGEAVDMDYGCDESGADNDVYEPTLENDFNYATSTNKIDYEGTSNYDIVIDELENDRPVIFRGNKKGHIMGIFPYSESGHAWVADGYQHDFYCDTGTSYLYFHMNWGWDGQYNSWYDFNDFTPGDASFDYKSEVVVGINP